MVTRREIFDDVWRDVIVSDGALTQAIRTLRRTLGDDSREPMFIRTVSRHGYSFVFAGVQEGDDDPAAPSPENGPPAEGDETSHPSEGRAMLIERLLGTGEGPESLEDRRDAAQQLHALGTDLALAGLAARPGHADALALMRDTRWDVPEAGPVPLWGQPEGLPAAVRLVRWRAREALRVTRRRWAQAAGGAACAGAVAGLAGGALLALAPASRAPATAIPVLMALGAVAGFAGAAGVAAGIAAAEAVARSRRSAAILAGGSLGGLIIGGLLQALVGWTLDSVFGLRVSLGGPLEGLCLGGAVAAGYAATTSLREGGIAAPSGRARWRTAASCAAAAGDHGDPAVPDWGPARRRHHQCRGPGLGGLAGGSHAARGLAWRTGVRPPHPNPGRRRRRHAVRLRAGLGPDPPAWPGVTRLAWGHAIRLKSSDRSPISLDHPIDHQIDRSRNHQIPESDDLLTNPSPFGEDFAPPRLPSWSTGRPSWRSPRRTV